MNEIYILIITGILGGILSGMLGIGGGIIIVPILVYALGMSQKSAQGTSAALMLPPIGLLAVMNYYKEGYVNLRFAFIIAIAFILGGYVGSKIAIKMDTLMLKRVFAVIIILVGVKTIYDTYK